MSNLNILLYLTIILFLVSCFLFLILPHPAPVLGLGLGQAHSITDPFLSRPEVKFGYSSSTLSDLSGGDSWAAVERYQGQYNWSQMDQIVSQARDRNKNIWLQIQTSDDLSGFQNVPSWAINQGVQMLQVRCSGKNVTFPKPANMSSDIINPQDIVEITQNNVKAIHSIPAIWDPTYRSLLSNALMAMKNHFATDFASGTIEAVNIMSGGTYGEGNIGPKCAVTDTSCFLKDVLNPNCSIFESLSSVTKKPKNELAQQSYCNSGYNPATGEGEKVVPCFQNCPTQHKQFCYVADDYFIQAMKDQITRYVKIFSPTPVVYQYGNGPSDSGRVSQEIMTWAHQTYGSRVWFKFNGFGPQQSYFYEPKFANYPNTRHGYEPGGSWFFSKDYWASKGGDQVAKTAIEKAVNSALVGDKSAYLTLQEEFYKDGQYYYFNPDDTTPDCRNSQIKNWCAGFLNNLMTSQPVAPPPPLPDIYNFTKLTLFDLAFWKDAYSSGVYSPTADFNHDQLVDLTDLMAWKQSYLQ
ncbi:MAG: hypothetical protein WCV93_01225 [Candidatus Shapirobacteria bacterium]